VTPLKQVGEKAWILELFHGPTFAFKDVALQILGNLFEFFLRRKNAKKQEGEKNHTLTIVGATSGDTGRYAAFYVMVKVKFINARIQALRYMGCAARRIYKFSFYIPRGESLLYRRLR
jgi:threonine synthase